MLAALGQDQPRSGRVLERVSSREALPTSSGRYHETYGKGPGLRFNADIDCACTKAGPQVATTKAVCRALARAPEQPSSLVMTGDLLGEL